MFLNKYVCHFSCVWHHGQSTYIYILVWRIHKQTHAIHTCRMHTKLRKNTPKCLKFTTIFFCSMGVEQNGHGFPRFHCCEHDFENLRTGNYPSTICAIHVCLTMGSKKMMSCRVTHDLWNDSFVCVSFLSPQRVLCDWNCLCGLFGCISSRTKSNNKIDSRTIIEKNWAVALVTNH